MSYANQKRRSNLLRATGGALGAVILSFCLCTTLESAENPSGGSASSGDSTPKKGVLASGTQSAAPGGAQSSVPAGDKSKADAASKETPAVKTVSAPVGTRQIMMPIEGVSSAGSNVAAGPDSSNLQQEISLDLRDMDIVDVLKFLSLKGKFNLAISKTVSGRVTLAMKRVSIKNALDIILKSNGLASYWMDNIVYIMPGEEYLNTYGKKFDDKTSVRIFNLKYAKPSYVLATLDSVKSNIGKVIIDEDTGSVVLIDTSDNLDKMITVLKQMDSGIATSTYKLQYATAKDIAAQLKLKLDAKSVGSIQADERSNQVIVSALPERLKEIEKLIKELDAQTKAVLIEVRILKIITNPQFNSGINWSNPFGQSGGGFFGHTAVAQSFPIASTISQLGTVGSLTYGGAASPNMLQAQIQLLKQVADTRTIARPRLMVTNNEEANIHIGDTIPYVTSTTTGTGDTATVSEQINFIDVGIKLKVKPTINDDGFVTIKIRPEISSETKTVLTPKGAAIPQVNTTFVETTAIVKDGYTIIIGGLKQLQNDDTTNGLPGAMDVPVIGNAFKSTAKSSLNTEICILLTPHIVGGNKNVIDQKTDILPEKDDREAQALSELSDELKNQIATADGSAVPQSITTAAGEQSNIKPKRKLKNDE